MVNQLKLIHFWFFQIERLIWVIDIDQNNQTTVFNRENMEIVFHELWTSPKTFFNAYNTLCFCFDWCCIETSQCASPNPKYIETKVKRIYRALDQVRECRKYCIWKCQAKKSKSENESTHLHQAQQEIPCEYRKKNEKKKWNAGEISKFYRQRRTIE